MDEPAPLVDGVDPGRRLGDRLVVGEDGPAVELQRDDVGMVGELEVVDRRRAFLQAIAPLRAGGQWGVELPGQFARVGLTVDELAAVEGLERGEGVRLPPGLWGARSGGACRARSWAPGVDLDHQVGRIEGSAEQSDCGQQADPQELHPGPSLANPAETWPDRREGDWYRAQGSGSMRSPGADNPGDGPIDRANLTRGASGPALDLRVATVAAPDHLVHFPSDPRPRRPANLGCRKSLV